MGSIKSPKAIGILGDITDITDAPGGNWALSVQEHKAEKAGKHYDLRLVAPNGIAYSWAGRYWPSIGERRLYIRQPDHSAGYALNFEGTIPEGYGKGTVRIVRRDAIHMDTHTNDKITWQGKEGKFTMIHTGGNDWLLMKRKSSGASDDISAKRSLKMVKPGIPMDRYWVMPKIDGAHAIAKIKHGDMRLYSPRISTKTGERIEYTDKVPIKVRRLSPIDDVIIRGELFAVKDGKVLPHTDTASVLLSSPRMALAKQAGNKMAMKFMPFDIDRFNGVDVTGFPFVERREYLKSVSRKHGLDIIPIATTDKEKEKLIKSVFSGKHPLTSEGVVLADPLGTSMLKMKKEDTHDVYIREIFEGKNKYAGNGAGGFTYSHTKHGRIVGKVGTGLSDQLRHEMHRNPSNFIGRVAVVAAQGKYPSGALRTPSFRGLHLDK